MTSKHTPGPWSVWSDDLTIRAGVLNLATISEFVSSTTGDGNYDVLLSEEQAEANARLIAAAPELYDAVAAVIDATRDYLPPDGITKNEFISRVIAATDNARMAEIMK